MAPKEQESQPGEKVVPNFRGYPKGRETLLKSGEKWLKSKVINDDLKEPYWRVHDKLYDLTNFAAIHPGGRDWIDLTKGTDITEAFETAHVFDTAENMLKKYYVKDITTPRYSPYTFEQNDFYKVLKKRVQPILKKVGTGPTKQMLLLQDSMAFAFVTFMILTALYDSYVLAIITGIILELTASIAHNFFHQKDGWRRFYFDLTFLTSRDWRITHALSHHLFPNTIMDYEISITEPFLDFLPTPSKSWFKKYGVLVYAHLVYMIGFHMELFRRTILMIKKEYSFRPENSLIFIELGIMMMISTSVGKGYLLWNVIHCSCSFVFIYIGLLAAHHHPDIYHEGDTIREHRDFGFGQMDAVRDRVEITGSLFLVAASFGDHTLHHLFPTVDHSKLPHLYEEFFATCKEFNHQFKFMKHNEMWWGKYAQLSRSKPNPNPPGYQKSN